MPAKNFVNFHVLISHSPSCLNRDDMNMQKTAVFGGVNRVRVSSQSLKRAMRTSDYHATHLGVPSIRTRDLTRLQTRFTEALQDRFDAARVAQTLEWMSGKEGIATGAGSDAVAPWCVEEVAYFCSLLGEEGQDLKKLEKQIEKEAKPFRAAIANAKDIALSGRMATSGLMSNLPVDGAMAIAHAITKQQSFAAHNLADFAIVSFADQPISLANAFEEPIKRDRSGGFLKPSVVALADYWSRINEAYGLDENARAFSLQADSGIKGKTVGKLAELESWLVADGPETAKQG